MQKAIEVEYWTVDEEGALVEPGALTEFSENVEGEFVEPLFELKTEPYETIPELRAAFVDRLAETVARADELGKRLVPLGTPIGEESIDFRPSERGRVQRAVIGDRFRHAKHCAGTHLHFEQRNVVDQLNVLLGIDPVLALANSSPYYRGERLADGARAYLYRRRTYELFPDHGQLWEYVDTVAEWERRLQARYEEFRTAAIDAGVDADAVDRHFSTDDAVWAPVRLREEMPTVEWRSPDATLPSEILRLTADVDRLMEGLHHTSVQIGTAGAFDVADDGVTLPPFDELRDLTDAAMHDGLGSATVRTYLDRMGFSPREYDPLSRWIDGPARVSEAEARALRLRCARRLREDVAALREAASESRSRIPWSSESPSSTDSE
ncbi:glutamate-cysteine ligase family protein [Halovivax sp.]|uniref:glutamate-cysteine ligase family protein n=1 Tax=Halovivax sp. TaxID=1935978 RepID=UPI0025C3DDB3|nr:glutamate-cysteine ligase family protein [Halovivax sp.]